MATWIRLCQPRGAFLTSKTITKIASKIPQRAVSALVTIKETPKLDDPHHYTGGRWLHNDQLERDSRYINFDFAALCNKAVNVCPGATKVVRYEKKEGHRHRVFIFNLDNGSRVVGKIPHRDVGRPMLATNSEVATMAFMRSFVNIPIPKVLDWGGWDNAVGTEYIIMENAPGIHLSEKWPSMNCYQRLVCVENLSYAVVEMAKLTFPAYGSLYFENAHTDSKSKIEFGQGFCIGPYCSRPYWNRTVTEPRFYDKRLPHKGPWTNLQSYCNGLIDSGISQVLERCSLNEELPHRGSVQEHLRLLEISREVINDLVNSPIIQKVAGGTFLHPDLHQRHIFVSEDDPSRITAIIGWDSVDIEPAFRYVNCEPDLVQDPIADISMINQFMSGNDDSTEQSSEETPEEKAAREKHEHGVKLCQQAFEVVLWGFSSKKLGKVRALNPTLIQIFNYCGISWINGAAALRQELVELSQQWTDLGLSGSCKYQPTAEELAEHKTQYEDFIAIDKLKFFLARVLGCRTDGWIPADEWETAQKDHMRLFDLYIKSTAEPGECDDQVRRKIWPFNETGY